VKKTKRHIIYIIFVAPVRIASVAVVPPVSEEVTKPGSRLQGRRNCDLKRKIQIESA
jgi:hypothetical protein